MNTPSDNPKIDNAKKEIRNMITPLIFIITSLLLMIIIVELEGITEKNGSGFIFFALVLIFIVWVSVILHTRNHHKRHSHHYLKESSPQQHE